MTGGQCVGDVCHNPTLLSYQKSLWSEVAFAVQRWWAVTPIRPGMLGMRSLAELQWNPKTENGIQRPYRPPPGLLGLIYGLSSGQEIPHFPSLGLFCNGKLHHLPNLRNISMGEILEDWTHQLKVSLIWPGLKNPVCFGLIQLNSDHFKGESWFITVVQDLISESGGLQFPDTLLSMMIYTALVGINGKLLFSWVQLSLISPLQPPSSSDNACQTKLQHDPSPFQIHNIN